MKGLCGLIVYGIVCVFILTACGTNSPVTSTPAATAATKTLATTSTPAAATAATKTAATPQYGGTMRVILGGNTGGAPGSPIGYPPEAAGSSFTTMNYVVDCLLREDDKGNITPALATSYDVNADPNNISITFHLRQGVKFHDGTDFNAQAVKWNFEMNKSSTLNAAFTTYWKSFDIIDDYTIRINHTTWQNRFIRSFSTSPTQLVSPTAYQKNGVDWVRWNIVGTGAFKQIDFQRDVSLSAVRNDNTWEAGKPYLSGLQLLYVADNLTAQALFKSGGADVFQCDAQTAYQLSQAGYQILTQPNSTYILVPDSMNANSPWSNAKVRMAAEYAIDKLTMTKTFGYGYMQAATQLPSPNSKAFDTNLPGRTYDPAKAKQLLSDAGYPNGFNSQIIMQVGQNKDMATAIQSYLKAIGINVDVQVVEAAKMSQLQMGTWENALLWGTPIEYTNFNATFNTFYGVPPTWYRSLKKPDGYEDAFKASLTSMEQDPALMKKCVDLFYNDCTVIPLSCIYSTWATVNNIHDTGCGQRGSTTASNPQNAWFSK